MEAGAPNPAAAAALARRSERLAAYHGGRLKGNAALLQYNRIFAALVAGVAAGVAGVTGARGFLLFAASQLAVAAGVAARAGFAPRRFFPAGVGGLFSGLASQVELLTFVLFWTLAQNAVYLYG